jgi:hypothetical protein
MDDRMDMGSGNIGGGDLDSDTGADLGSDIDSDMTADIDSTPDANLGSDLDSDVGGDLNTTTDMDTGDDLNGTDGLDGLDSDVLEDSSNTDELCENLNEGIPENGEMPNNISGDEEPTDIADDSDTDLNEEANDAPSRETDAFTNDSTGEDLNDTAPDAEAVGADLSIEQDDIPDIQDEGTTTGDGGETVDTSDENLDENTQNTLDNSTLKCDNVDDGDEEKPPGDNKDSVDPHDIPDEYGNSFNERMKQTPVNNGEWGGERGDSKWIPETDDVAEKLDSYGVNGIDYHDGFPDFSPVTEYEHQLPKELYESSDSAQFNDCNGGLSRYLDEHPELSEHFDADQLEAIQAGEKPSGFSWHHDVEPGRMQLVPTRIHQNCGHYGGKNIWGGGADNR